MKQKIIALAIALFAASAASAQSLTTVPASAFTGAAGIRPGFTAPQGNFRPYDTTGNLALAGGLVQAAVTKDLINNGGLSVIHDAPYLNDGLYGNGTSWIGATANSWLKIDFGQAVLFDRVWLGRDRTNGFDDREPGQFLIQVASSDVYANGNDAGDATEYTTVFDSAALAYSGIIAGSQTIQAQFAAPVSARYLKITVASPGAAPGFNAAIDEMQVFRGSPVVVPEAGTLALLTIPLLTLGAIVRRSIVPKG